jgi:ubiquitin-activating enzyme E1
MPLKQWLHFDCFECLPEGEADRSLQGTRYDDYIAVLGREVFEKIANAKTFMVGAGALGCEFLKGFAMMGLGSGPNGKVTCTDDDTIEISNLNR